MTDLDQLIESLPTWDPVNDLQRNHIEHATRVKLHQAIRAESRSKRWLITRSHDQRRPIVPSRRGFNPTDPDRPRQYGPPRRALAALLRTPRLAIATAIVGLAVIASVAVVSVTAGTAPAYAVTQNANGTYTITINDIATGLPALNTNLQQLGIDAVAVPVTNTCKAASSSLTERIEAQLSPALASNRSGGLLNLDQATIPTGSEGVIAAYQSPTGQINLTFWTASGSAPSCLNTSAVVPSALATSTQP